MTGSMTNTPVKSPSPNAYAANNRAAPPRWVPVVILSFAAFALIAAFVLGSLMGAGHVVVTGKSSKAKLAHGVWTYATLEISGDDRVTIYEADTTTQLTPPPGEPNALPRAQVYTRQSAGQAGSFQPNRTLQDDGTASATRQRNTLPLTLDRLDQQGWEVVVQLPSTRGVRLLIRKPR